MNNRLKNVCTITAMCLCIAGLLFATDNHTNNNKIMEEKLNLTFCIPLPDAPITTVSNSSCCFPSLSQSPDLSIFFMMQKWDRSVSLCPFSIKFLKFSLQCHPSHLLQLLYHGAPGRGIQKVRTGKKPGSAEWIWERLSPDYRERFFSTAAE